MHYSWKLHTPSQYLILSMNSSIFQILLIYNESVERLSSSAILNNTWETGLETSEPFSFWSAVSGNQSSSTSSSYRFWAVLFKR